MRFPTMVRLAVGLVMLMAVALSLAWSFQGTLYVVGTLAALAVCLFTVSLALEPELRGTH